MNILNTFFKKRRKKKVHKKKSVGLYGAPQKKGVCIKVRVVKPKKPNSAQRKIAKVKISKDNFIIGYIPGFGHTLHEHSRVLIRGGRVKDLPGVHYHLVRGKYDFVAKETEERVQRRSKYGIKKEKKSEKTKEI